MPLPPTPESTSLPVRASNWKRASRICVSPPLVSLSLRGGASRCGDSPSRCKVNLSDFSEPAASLSLGDCLAAGGGVSILCDRWRGEEARWNCHALAITSGEDSVILSPAIVVLGAQSLGPRTAHCSSTYAAWEHTTCQQNPFCRLQRCTAELRCTCSAMARESSSCARLALPAEYILGSPTQLTVQKNPEN